MPACKFTKKTLLHIFFHVFYLHFLRMYHDYFCRRGLKVCKCNLFQRKVVLLVIYLFTIFMLNMAFDVLLNTVFVKYSELESFVSCNIKLFALCFDMYFFIKFSIMVNKILFFDIWMKFTVSKVISTRKEW